METLATISETPETLRLLEACKGQNRAAQKELYETYKSTLFRICLRYAPGREEAEDMLQEGFIRIFKSIHTWQPLGSFEGWIKKIMLNVVLENHRKNLSKGRNEELKHADSFSDDSDSISQIASQELLAMVQSLPSGYRTVFNLFAIEGYSHAEIAELLNISEGTSKSQYSRARTQLQSLCHHYLHQS